MNTKVGFGAVDYTVLSATFLVSIGIGVFFGIKDRGSENKDQYLMGNRKLSLIPVALSITVSLVSTNALLGVPAELYNNGITFAFIAIPIILSTVIVATLFVPVMYPLKIISINEYLEKRFLSKPVRYLGCVMYLLNSLLYVGTVIYGPATALNIAAGAPPWAAIIIVGVIGTVYTTMGGMKAVVWTDAFQSTVMVAGMVFVSILGANQVGGMGEVVRILNDWRRFEVNTQMDLTTRYSVFSMVLGFTIHWTASYGVTQSCTQRYCAMQNMRKGQLSMLLNGPCNTVLTFLAMLTGAVAFAFYTSKGCDPIKAEVVSNSNQIIPYFVMEVLAYPGLPGIFLSAIFSASLSTLSSSINSMAAVTWEDIFKEHFPSMTPEKQSLTAKLMVVAYGCACVAMSFLVMTVGGNLAQIALTFMGATTGPLLGLFILGALFPWANSKGALTGGLFAIFLTSWIMFGQVFAKIGRKTLPSPIHNCWNSTAFHNISAISMLNEWNTPTMETLVDALPQGCLEKLYSLSFSWFALLGTISVIIVGILVSLATGGNDTENMDSRLLFVFLRKRYGKPEQMAEQELKYSSEPGKENGVTEETYHLMHVA